MSTGRVYWVGELQQTLSGINLPKTAGIINSIDPLTSCTGS